MKNKSIFVALSALMVLAGCNAGNNTNSSDVQTNAGSIGQSPNTFAITSLTATGCKTISVNGNCSVNIVYNGTGTFVGSLAATFPITGYTSPNISSCQAVSAISHSCTFTISNTGASVSSAQNVNISSNGQAGLNLFVVGGGM
jgi:hypothetical protein